MKTRWHDSIPPKGLRNSLRFCTMCEKETPHATRRISDASIQICVSCLECATLNKGETNSTVAKIGPIDVPA